MNSSNYISDIYVRPTEWKRWSGLKDLARGLISVIGKIVNIAASIFHSKNPSPSNPIDLRDWKNYKLNEDQVSSSDIIMRVLRAQQAALQKVTNKKVDLDGEIDEIFKKSNDDPSQYIKKITKLHKKQLKGKKIKKEFKLAQALQLGMQAPKELEHKFTIENCEVKEEAKLIDLSIGAKFLREKGMNDHAEFIEKNKGLRPSSYRSPENAQGMTTNGWKHTFSVGNDVVNHEYRSGAFAVHSKEIKDSDERLNLGIAQALPIIIDSIKERTDTPKAENRFLFSWISLLSDEYIKDRKMIEEMNRVLNHLRDNLAIRFEEGADEESVHFENETIVITLPETDELKGEFGVETLFFTQGVNELQSSGHLFQHPWKKSLQDQINKENLECLLNYESDIDGLDELKRHYGKKGKRKAKDIEGMVLIRDAVKSLGGTTATVCKSGKDRTGMFVSLNHSAAFEGSTEEVFKKLSEGISYTITGLNSGKAPAYAFNAFQRSTLPKELRPSSKLCGSVAS